MKHLLAICIALASATLFAKGLYCGEGGMSPMEARLERAAGNKSAKSNRIQNAQRASARLKSAVPGATNASEGEKVSYKKVTKGCCNSKQTISASGGAKVGVGSTKSSAAAAARANKSSKTT